MFACARRMSLDRGDYPGPVSMRQVLLLSRLGFDPARHLQNFFPGLRLRVQQPVGMRRLSLPWQVKRQQPAFINQGLDELKPTQGDALTCQSG